MFELADDGFVTVFQAAHLLHHFNPNLRKSDPRRIPEAVWDCAHPRSDIAALSVDEIDRLIHPCTFHKPKAGQIQTIAKRAIEQHGGEIPADQNVLLQFSGVGCRESTEPSR